uniref:Uncharacterized protein n=1 Tax=Chaetoceros debilis TaxID=122233 RepID=A0A7S3QAL4_9STRA
MSGAWNSAAEDFGQKVDLTVRIREILRNYPEGLSILKELIQNADDAGARTIRFCAAEARSTSGSANENSDPLSNIMKGPSLLSYNSAKFSDTDFKSIQRIGDSLKKDKNGTKTGRFGVGVNSTYHLTDVPMFVSGSKVVMFDPQASFVPGINPANPGKLIDCAKTNGRSLVESLPNVFDPLKVFGCDLSGKEFNGTTFRFALRTEEQAEVSRLSRQSHSLENIRDLLRQMAAAAPSMLLFLKNVECIEIYDWKENMDSPTMMARTFVGNATEKLRARRSYVLSAPSRVPASPQAVDYILDIESSGSGIKDNGGVSFPKERWMVCNQLGGGNASIMARDKALDHMKLVPWAGVAARLSPDCNVEGGNAYCFLPLPVRTKLPIHVNGYFELSSNRRDVWWGDDMAGDGKARAEWNKSIVQDIAGPSYVRLVEAAIRNNLVSSITFELLFPQRSLSGPWLVLANRFLNGIRDVPVLHSACASPQNWVAPSKSLLMHDENDTKLIEILSKDKLPLVLIKSAELKALLLERKTCTNTTTPELLRRYYSRRKTIANGSLEDAEHRLEYAEYLLKYCKSDINPTQISELSGCQFVPLASGELGRFCVLPNFDQFGLKQLQSMGFSLLLCMHALRISKDNIDSAMEWLLTNRYSNEASTVQHGVDPYLVCNEDTASLLRKSASNTFVDLEMVNDPSLRKFFTSGAVSSSLNVLPLQSNMLADVVARAVPSEWRGKESAHWDLNMEHPNLQWFTDLWRFVCSCSDIEGSLKSVAEQFCIVPTKQEVVCTLSPGNAVLDPGKLDKKLVDCLVELGVLILYEGVLPSDLIVPQEIYSYIMEPTRDGVVRVVDAATRRQNDSQGQNRIDQSSDDVKSSLFSFFAKNMNSTLSESNISTLRSFQIFRAYTNNNSMETKWVPMSRSGRWYVLPAASEEERMFMTSDFLATFSNTEVDLLILLGAKKMSKSDFFKKVVLPQLSQASSELGDKLIQDILVNLPSICSHDSEFNEFLSNSKFIRSSESQTLKAPSELYDPEVPQLLTLMNQDSFPDEFYMNPDLLLSLRKLGLQSTLSWDTVLECACSIESESTKGDQDLALSAKARGAELLLFLDMHVDTFFPEFQKNKSSRTGRLFRKMNSALFEDSEQKQKNKEVQAHRIQKLLNTKWMPVYQKPPQPYLPWPENCESVAAPVETVPTEKMWLASYSKRLVDGDVHSSDIKKLFGWLNEVSVKDVGLQLRMLSSTFEKKQLQQNEAQTKSGDEKEVVKMSSLRQKYSSEIGRIYHILNSIESEYEMEVIQSILHQSPWLWMGDGFVSSDHVAYSSSINAHPYLFTVPPDLACYRNLLSAFNIRDTFGSSDYCLVLNRMAKDTKSDKVHVWGARQVELAVNLVQKISDDVLRLKDLEIYAPTEDGQMEVVNKLVYDDAPWLSKDLPGKKGLVYVHPKISASVCEKIGVKSVRKLLLQNNADMISFGDGVVHEAFGQSESLTRRLKNIVEMYPEGPQQLSELIQNADDAKATVVRFVVSMKQHGTSSLLGQKMSEWQGGALYCYNDSTFTSRDFDNLAKIGQASKLEKLSTTGRFGLGFNSVFHWTDVPSIVSGDYLVMFDPHARYVPGASDMSRGMKIRFTHTELASQFPDQMIPYCLFGNDMKQRFNGTLFRFPFRNEKTAKESEISKKQYGDDVATKELIDSFKNVISKVVLFLRHVKRVEFYVEGESDQAPKLQYYADVGERKALSETHAKRSSTSNMSGLESIRSLANSAVFGGSTTQPIQSDHWNSISNFISGNESQPISKEAFYSKLLRTPEQQLPQTKHLVTITFGENTQFTQETSNIAEERQITRTDKYLICSALGSGQCRAMACNPKHRDLKFLPWGSVAVHLTRNEESPPNERGNAFCFLPLPSETGFAVHINGYFELSANRRDIWFGADMTGAGQVRYEWNRLLLRDVISPLYTQILLTARSLIGPGDQFNRMWPTEVSSDIWKVVRSRVFQISESDNLPLMHTPLNGGRWVDMKSAVFLEKADNNLSENEGPSIARKRLLEILQLEDLSVVNMPTSVIKCMKDESCLIREVNPPFIREWFKKDLRHPSLKDRDNAVFLLRFCIDEIVEGRNLRQLHGLPLLPLTNGGLGLIGDSSTTQPFFIANQTQNFLLKKGSRNIVDVWTSDSRLNGYLMNEDFHQNSNSFLMDSSNFVRILAESFPPEWEGLPEVHWIQDLDTEEAVPSNPKWISKLWGYIASDTLFPDLSLFLEKLQIVPALVGEGGDKTLQVLTANMAVVNVSNAKSDGAVTDSVGRILRSIGIRTLDSTVFGEDATIVFRALDKYIQLATAKGIVAALSNSFPDQLSTSDIVKRMAGKFKYIEDADKRSLRNFLRDSSLPVLNSDEICVLRSLPIYETFAVGGKEIFSHLVDNSHLPPACADRTHLDNRFVKASTRREVDFYSKIGLCTMSPQDYYTEYVPHLLANNKLAIESRSNLVIKMLQDSLRLADDENGKDFVNNLKDIKFVPNCKGELVRPTELYDPNETGLVDLVDESMLPVEELRHGTSLQSLRLLGMSRELSSDGILESARQIELQAKNLSIMEEVEDTQIEAVRKRATSLLNFLDEDSTIRSFIDSKRRKSGVGSVDESDNLGQIEVSLSDDESVISELLTIAWLPVEKTPSNLVDELNPPRVAHQLSGVGISSPQFTRPKVDDWICSSTMDILSINTKSSALEQLFQWDLQPSIVSVASQLVALSQHDVLRSNEQSYRQKMSKVSIQIYEILDNHMDAADHDERERALMILQGKPWIWVGDNFVTNSQVAFNAPDNARPYLYSVPDQMLCYENLLKACGVRDSFSGEDYMLLLSTLTSKLQGDLCNTKQLDLAIFVARNLSRITPDEFNLLDKSLLYLPSKEGRMYRASEMTFDDAPWLSAIVKKTRHVFVHPDVGNEVARILGSKSLRDVLSANQNGMVKIPCPKHEALHQLFSRRSIKNDECCRAVLELLEIAELKGTKQISILLDRRQFGTMSLLHPFLAPAQGPAIVVCFHDVAIEVDDLVKLTSPAKYYSSTTSGGGGCGGSGFPRYGRGLCGAFTATDCLQVLSGRSLLIFDPSGNYLIEDKNQQTESPLKSATGNRREKANARNYGLSHSFCKQFPDQFEPFLSLSAGVQESMVNGNSTPGGPYFRGTIIRLPLRTQDGPTSPICSKVFGNEDLDELSSLFQDALPKTLLFSYHLQGISFDQWMPNEEFQETIQSSRVSSSPLSRRSHLEEMSEPKVWKKEKSKLGKMFKSSWVPRRRSHMLQITSRIKGEINDVVDTYAIHSVLAPPRLREMACTESLSPLKLIPTVGIAAHLDRSCGQTPATSDFNLPKGKIFVGFDTGIQTGLPFHINAPLFMHEWLGTVLLGSEDDLEFKSAFPGIRNIVITDKYNTEKARSLALYVWNRQALTSAIHELLPYFLTEIKEPLQTLWARDPRLFYKFWPYSGRVRPNFKDFVDASVYRNLTVSTMEIYLTEKDGFQAIDKGCFSCPDFELHEAAIFFLQHMALFTTPRLVVEDLTKFGIEGRQLTPTVARSLLRNEQHASHLTGRSQEAMAVLEYCLADMKDEHSFQPLSQAALQCKRQLTGLPILPLSDGSMGRIGSQIIVADTEQQSMLPMLNNKFLSSHVLERLQHFFSKPGSLELLSLETFSPKVLARNIQNVLPRSWEGKDFVEWNPDDVINNDSRVPSKLWLYRFWQQVSISDHDAVQLFQRWPLIPVKSGQLASCGNLRFLLYMCIAAKDHNTYRFLCEEDRRLRQIEDNRVRTNPMQVNRIQESGESPDNDIFWNMGETDDNEDLDENHPEKPKLDDELCDNETGDDISIHAHDLDTDSSPISMSTNDDTNAHDNDPEPEEQDISQQPQPLGYDPNSESLKNLYKILLALKCPLLDSSFFDDDKVKALLPVDRLGVSRSIMTTLNQGINYWPTLSWSVLSPTDFENLILLLSSHERNRLSLMISDLTLMKNLPIFETVAGTYVSIQDRDENFTLDASVDSRSVAAYLPRTLQAKVLADKSELKDLYEDLNVQVLNEATILQKFVLAEFDNMPITQKEAVVKSILEKWNVLRLSDGLLEVLRETAFVKRKHNNQSEVVYVKPGQLFDPRNGLFSAIFDKDRSQFPAEEFASDNALNMLEEVGLCTEIDKDTFLKCAWIVEGELDVAKGSKLLEYFADNFDKFYDGAEFVNKLAEIKCVPAELEGQRASLYRFAEIAAPKDRNLSFKVMPVMSATCAPPQVMFSSLGIVSPPPISIVLRQIRELTEDDGILDQWSYNHSSAEQVFSDLFSFLQDHYSDLSPRIKEALAERPLVPIGSAFVKSSRLFFRLTKDLAPFFYEVPRAFGAYDILLRSLGVRDSPKSDDYAVSLAELNTEIGTAKLNANELNSVVEVVSLAASDKSGNQANEEIFAPNQYGRLTKVSNLMQNDCPWLVHCGRIDVDQINLVHPKISKDICGELQIKCMSERVVETLDTNIELKEILMSMNSLGNTQNMMKSKEFLDTLRTLSPRSQIARVEKIQDFNICEVESIQTRFLVLNDTGRPVADVTNRRFKGGPVCFINKNQVLLTQLPPGISAELAIATSLCEHFRIERKHLAGISALLASQNENVEEVKKMMGLFDDKNHDELLRGEPGYTLVETDLELVEIKPLKSFKNSEIVAVRESNNSSQLVYGIVCDKQDSSSMSRLRVRVGSNKEVTFLSSQVYSLKGGSKGKYVSTPPDLASYNLSGDNSTLLRPLHNGDVESSLHPDPEDLGQVGKDEILRAVQDLLISADLNLNDDAAKMLDSNLALKEQLAKKSSKIESVKNLSRRALKGIDSFLCPITREPFEDPVICCDGHTYERAAIEMWLRSNSRSPKTNQPLPSTDLIPNHSLRSSIEAITEMTNDLKNFAGDDFDIDEHG